MIGSVVVCSDQKGREKEEASGSGIHSTWVAKWWLQAQGVGEGEKEGKRK